MSDQVQSILDGAQYHMRSLSSRMYVGPAANRALYSFVTVVVQPFLTEEQQQQVQDILDLHDECVSKVHHHYE